MNDNRLDVNWINRLDAAQRTMAKSLARIEDWSFGQRATRGGPNGGGEEFADARVNEELDRAKFEAVFALAERAIAEMLAAVCVMQDSVSKPDSEAGGSPQEAAATRGGLRPRKF